MKKNFIISSVVLPAIIVLMFILPHTTSAQVSGNYDLSAYKLPDIRYQSLVTVFELSGRNQSNKFDDRKVLDRYFSGDAGANYNSFLNTRKVQRYQNANINLTGRSSYEENLLRTEEVSDYYSNLSYQIYNKWYFPNKLFIATGAYARYHYGHIRDKYDDTTNIVRDATTNEHTVSLRIPLEFGIGRIEQVQDYYEAIYIYEDLLKSGRAVAGKTEQEVMELATFVSQLKNRRYFDSRIRNIEDIEKLDSFLLVNNFKTQSDARYFATLVDNWNFVTHFVRESGTSIALAVNPELSYYRENKLYNLQDIRQKYIRGSYGAEGGIVFEHHKPINLYWQTNTSLRAMGGLMQNIFEISDTIVRSEYTSTRPEIDIYLNHSLQYYPNTRTRMTATVNASYLKFFDETEEDGHVMREGSLYFNSGISLDVDYYISQRLRFNADASLTYVYSTPENVFDPKVHRLHSGVSARLAYSIF